MCGIVAYIGNKNCKNILINGLKRLEYRGYDSAGIGILIKSCNKNAESESHEAGLERNRLEIKVVKQSGKINDLEKLLEGQEVEGTVGIGHTRWATHGQPNQLNSHPHYDCSKKIAVVHNGIIENYAEIKEELIKKGHKFISETDTEVLPHLLEEILKTDPCANLLIAMQILLKKIKGSGAIVALGTDYPDELIAGRIASPLIAGISKDGNFFASDMPAILEHTHDFVVINDYETVRLTRDKVEIYNPEGILIQRDVFKATWTLESAEKAGYEDFMLKEIFEQPYGIRETMRGRITNGIFNFDELELDDDKIKNLKKIQIIACGTSYHSALTGKLVIEKWAKIPVEVDIGSEYRYRSPLVDENSLFIAITQSGETIDTLAAVKEARKKGAKVMAITNVVGSTISRESDSVIYTHAGPEIGVCATKTFTAQIIVMYLIGLYLAKRKNLLSEDALNGFINELEIMPAKVQQVLNNAGKIKKIADNTYRHTCFLFLGRIYGFPMALEGALKLKEISYIHAEGYAAGEMKHGPIALTDTKTIVVGVIPEDFVYDKMLSNLQEVKARNAKIFALVTEGDANTSKYADYTFEMPKTFEELYGILEVVPLQLYAYYIAKNLGRNVDQPRNLAKSVTVE
ncbi:MAG: glutamine--fructose-6-phosphate transaminase (isomerizing) [Actinobacteria bacterium]|nr:glutamine--fructose-6-phosphate transaminase (isomerizing) [Actinomycetota bacterium]